MTLQLKSAIFRFQVVILNSNLGQPKVPFENQKGEDVVASERRFGI